MSHRNTASAVLALGLTVFCLGPFLYLLVSSLQDAAGTAPNAYYTVFLGENQYLLRFWKSLALALVIGGGQLLVSILAGFAFARYAFPGKRAIFFGLMVLMIMPLQVTLVPNYLMLDKLGLLNTYAALALPAFFVPLGTFIMTRSFRAVPKTVLEAAQLDGCGTLRTIFQFAVPLCKSGVVCTALLSFLDGWNMVEQPIVYLEEFSIYPLSVGLASTPPEEPAVQLVCCVLAAIPPLLLFACYNQELVEGIVMGGEK